MKNLISEQKSRESGFTLVELLVVIVIIGILAVGILAAINPIEQIRRGRDTASQAAAREFMTACERYYGTEEEYPWGTSPPSAADISSYVSDLVAADELRDGFSDRSPVADGDLLVTEDGSGEIHVCFDPESTAFGNKANLGNDGTGSGSYFCVPDSTQ